MPRQPEGVRLSIAEALEVGGVIFGPVLAPSPRIAGFRTRWTRRVCCNGGFAGRRVVQREECNQPSASHAAASILDKAQVTSGPLLGFSASPFVLKPRATIATKHQVVSEKVMYKRAIAM